MLLAVLVMCWQKEKVELQDPRNLLTLHCQQYGPVSLFGESCGRASSDPNNEGKECCLLGLGSLYLAMVWIDRFLWLHTATPNARVSPEHLNYRCLGSTVVSRASNMVMAVHQGRVKTCQPLKDAQLNTVPPYMAGLQ
jgi:hypothetical protein